MHSGHHLPAPIQTVFPVAPASSRERPVFIGFLGSFLLLKTGLRVRLRPGGKVESLLAELALAAGREVPRGELVGRLWPSTEPSLASHSLNELVSSLHRQFGDSLMGQGPVVPSAGGYAINLGAGVQVDVVEFEAAADRGEASLRAGDREAARRAFAEASALYRGDLCVATDVRHVVYRERLRMRYLALESALADWLFGDGDYPSALERVLRLLSHEPCREDAHRLAIRCFMRLGERAQALRQYQVCRAILQAEFEAEPESATTALYHQVRLNPAGI